MDHHSLHGGQDRSTFSSSSSPHRLPTVSAAQALQDLGSAAAATRCVRTGLRALDCALGSREAWGGDVAGGRCGDADAGAGAGADGAGAGGVVRGQVVEVYGPPGVGKTALGIQLAANALCAGQGVVWVDAAHPLPGPRLKEVLLAVHTTDGIDQSLSPTEPETTSSLLKNLIHFVTPTLPHFIALLCHTKPTFPPQNTSLIVIDSLSVLVAAAYPRNVDNVTVRKLGTVPKHDPRTWAASRKWSVLQYIISSLQKLAALRDIAIVLLSQSVTKIQPGAGAILISAVSSTAWDAGVSTRIALFRDWGWEGKQVRFARVLRANGVADDGKRATGKVFAFTIEPHGLEEVQLLDTDTVPDQAILATPSRKRKAEEIRDSEDEGDLEGSDEDYGWAEEDDGELPQPPPQWQGSEDILVPGPEERADEDEDEDGEESELEEDEEKEKEKEESVTATAADA